MNLLVDQVGLPCFLFLVLLSAYAHFLSLSLSNANQFGKGAAILHAMTWYPEVYNSFIFRSRVMINFLNTSSYCLVHVF
jgi:hypothetical protein